MLGGRVRVAVDVIIEGNWIQTETLSQIRTSWAVIRDGEAIQSGEQGGSDPSGMLAYEAGQRWAALHCPGVSFHWRHRSASGPRGTERP
jgi:hypothetical protein